MAKLKDGQAQGPTTFPVRILITLLVALFSVFGLHTLVSVRYISADQVVSGVSCWAASAILLIVWWRTDRWKPSVLLIVATMFFVIQYTRLLIDLVRSLIRYS